MITPENITRNQAKRLVTLLKQETEYEIIAKLGPFRNMKFADGAIKQIEIKNKIRRLLFGTDNLVELNDEWGILKNKKTKRFK